MEHLFEYVTGSLSDVTFDVFAAEDIKAADGVSEDYFKADEKWEPLPQIPMVLHRWEISRLENTM